VRERARQSEGAPDGADAERMEGDRAELWREAELFISRTKEGEVEAALAKAGAV